MIRYIVVLLLVVNNIFAITIVDTVDFTLKNSEKLKTYELDSKISKKEIDKKFSRFLPTIDIYANSEVKKSYIDDEWTKQSSKKSGINIKYNLFNGFRDFSNLLSVKSAFKSKDFIYKHQQNKISLDAIKAHLNIVYKNKLYEIELENIKEDEELLKISKSISKVLGDTTPTIEVKTDLDYAKSGANETYKEIGVALFEYKMITNKKVTPKELQWPKTDPTLIKDIYKKIKNSNYLVQNYNYQLKQLEYEIKAKKGKFLPSVDVIGDFNTDGIRKRDSQKQNSIKLEFKYNIFNGFEDKSEIAQKKLEKMKILYEKKKAIKKIIKDTDTVKHSTNVYKTLIKQNKNTLKSLLNLRKLYIKQFVVGKRKIKDIIDLQKKIVNIKKDLIKNEFSVKLNYFYVLSYTGELVSFIKSNPIFKQSDHLSNTDISYSLKKKKKKIKSKKKSHKRKSHKKIKKRVFKSYKEAKRYIKKYHLKGLIIMTEHGFKIARR